MKIIKTGTTYRVYDESLVVLDHLENCTYKIHFNKMTGFYLEKKPNLEIKEQKVYGIHEKKADKVLSRFHDTHKNLGVILSGDKGIGKSLFARVLANKAIESGIPVIMVDDCIPGMDDFINGIEDEVMVLFDEFDKTFARTSEGNPQESLLSLFDGTSSGKKLFVITCNDYTSLSQYIINRPGRFHFHMRFEYPTADEVREYLLDKLKPEYHSEITKVVDFSRRTKLNYDCLSAISMEINYGEKFEDAVRDLNIIDDSYRRSFFDITVYTKEGVILSENNVVLDLFKDQRHTIGITRDGDGYSYANVRIRISDLIYDNKRDGFYTDRFEITYDNTDDDPDGTAIVNELKKLHYTHVEAKPVRQRDIHFRLG